MSAKADRRVQVAREAADYLDSIGERKRANDVRSVCRANASYKTTLAQLHRDNMDLRNKFVAADSFMVEAGAPSERVLSFSLNGELCGELLSSFDHECEKRGCEPADLIAQVLSTVAEDNLFAAVLDT